MNEFDLIRTYLAPLAGPEGLGLRDDAASFRPPTGHDLVLTKDTLVEGVHFPHGQYGRNTAHKLLRVNLSDLAAKAAKPVGYLLSIAWPRRIDLDPHFQDFTRGLATVQDHFDITLFGGDTVHIDGPLVVCATCIGITPQDMMIRRDRAELGDDLWVTGTIGDAYMGLQCALGRDIEGEPSLADRQFWLDAYHRPEPRLALRAMLRSFARASIDISDGLLADIEHILRASRVRAEIDIDAVPLSPATQHWCSQVNEDARLTLISAGDDYELAFSADSDHAADIHAAAKAIGVPITKIGSIIGQFMDESKANIVLRSRGQTITIQSKGYKHF